MWTNRQFNEPKRYGAYTCFGTVNKNTPHEVRTKFTAFWNGERFTDKDGDDLTQIDESAEWWFDMDKVANPIEL